jgi:ParB-like chromosome segregation protein Spo0J
MSKEPVDNIVWIPARELKPNSYNPNVVFNTELNLLEESILRNGWVQPIVINPNKIIIDGYHRYSLSLMSAKLQSKYAEEVPCVIVDISDAEAMMMTVRMNRAKGKHAAIKMSDIVQELIDKYELSVDDLVSGMGMTESEVGLLYDGTLLKHVDWQSKKYSKAWVPVETKHLSEEELREMGIETEESSEFERESEDNGES